jgi:hypothetical protein
VSLEARKRIAVGLLLAFAVWPGVHFVLAERLDFDPWNFFGWAMYALPNPTYDLRVAVISGDRVRRVELPPPLREQARLYLERRATLGRGVTPEPLARAVLRAEPGIDAVVVGVRKLVLDPESGRVEPRDEVQHRYER